MSREIDERIVAMHFDNEQFERGARQSIKTLEDLKAGLNLEGTSEGLDNISKAVSNSFGLKKTTRNVGLFSKALSGMGKVAKGAFNFTTAPIQAMADGLGTIGKYAQTVLGFNIGSKIVDTGEQVVRAFTIDPMKTGWDEYEMKIDSVKTIMSGTEGQFRKLLGDDYTEEKHLEIVKSELEKLNQYADKTVYSFSDMVSNIGKFTNAGVDLDTSVASIKGIANAAADAGQGANEASRAMYNLSQAIGVGKLTAIDWKSVEQANISTLKFKQSFIDIAAAMGNLEKIGDKYYLKEDKNATKASKKKKKLSKEEQEAALKAREVNAENFRETLAKGWADKDVIKKTLALWSGDIKWDEIMKWGFSAEEAKKLWDMADAASKAASEVRTFSKMYDALKESAQSGWSASYELIVGDTQEATKFWTDLSGRFDERISAAAKKRNKVLEVWRGKNDSKVDGRDILIKSLNSLLDSIWTISDAIGKAWKSVFGKISGETLMEWTVKFNDFTVRLKQWLGSLDDPKSNISKISKALAGLFKIVKLVANAFSKLVGFFASLFGPVFDVVVDALGSISDFLSRITKSKNPIITFIKSLTGTKIVDWLKKVGKGFLDLFANLKKNAVKYLRDNGLGGVVDFFKNAKDTIVNAWNTASAEITKFLTSTDLGKFLSDAWGWIKDKVVTVYEKVTDPESWQAVIDWFNQAKDTLSSAWTTAKEAVEKWFDESEVGKFLGNLWGWIKGAVSDAYTAITDPESWKAVADWFENVPKKLDGIWGRTQVAVITWLYQHGMLDFITNLWGWIKKTATTVYTTITNPESWQAVIDWLNGAKDTLSSAWTTAKEAVEKWINESGIGKFLGDLWSWIKKAAVDVYTTVTNPESWQAVIDWLNGAKDTLSSAWTTAKEAVEKWINESGIGKFLGDLWSWIKKAAVDVYTTVTNPESWQAVIDWLNGAQKTLSDTWNTVSSSISTFIKDSGIGEFFTNLWGWIVKQFSGNGEEKTEADGAVKETEELKASGEEIAEMVESTTSIFERITQALSNFWTSIGDNTILQGIGKFFSDLWSGIGEIVDSIKNSTVLGRLLNLIDRIAKLILDIIDKMVSLGEGVMQGDKPSIFTAIGGFLIALGLFFKRAAYVKNMNKLSENTDSIGTTLLKVSASVGIIAAAIAALGALDEKTFTDGALRIGGIAGVLGILVAALALLFKKLGVIGGGGSDGNEPKAAERVITNIVNKLSVVALLYVAMDKIIPIIEAIGKADIKPGVMIETLGGLSLLIAALIGTAVVISKVNFSTGSITSALMAVATIGITLAGLVGVITAVGLLVNSTDKGQTMKVHLAAVKTFVQGLGEILGAFTGGYTGSKDGAYMENMTEAMAKASESAKNIDQDGLDRLQTAMKALKVIGDNLPHDATAFETIFSGKIKFKDVGDALTSLVGGFAYATSLSNQISDSDVAQFNKVFSALEHLLSASEFFVKYNNFASKGAQGMLDFLRNLSKNPLSGDGAGMFAENLNVFTETVKETVKLFNGAIEEAAPDISIKPLLDTMIKDLEGTDEVRTQIQNSLRTLFGDVKITDANGNTTTGLYGGLSSLSGIGDLLDTDKLKTNGTFDIAKMFGIDLGSEDPAGINALFQGISKKIDITSFTEKGKTMMEECLAGMQSSLDDTTLNAQVSAVFTEDSLPEFFTQSKMEIVGTVTIDAANLSDLKNTITNQTTRNINAIYESANNLGGRIARLESAIRNMKIVLNTGTVAGAVDSTLGGKAALGSRTMVSP